MLLRRTMALLGVGAASIDLILAKDVFRCGEQITGHFEMRGGTIEQQLKEIQYDLVMVARKEGKTHIVESVKLPTPMMIHSQQSKSFPFTFNLPEDIPLSSDEIQYCFKTKLIFNEGIESRDHDDIQIRN